jgi:hypothetical protein
MIMIHITVQVFLGFWAHGACTTLVPLVRPEEKTGIYTAGALAVQFQSLLIKKQTQRLYKKAV